MRYILQTCNFPIRTISFSTSLLFPFSQATTTRTGPFASAILTALKNFPLLTLTSFKGHVCFSYHLQYLGNFSNVSRVDTELPRRITNILYKLFALITYMLFKNMYQQPVCLLYVCFGGIYGAQCWSYSAGHTFEIVNQTENTYRLKYMLLRV